MADKRLSYEARRLLELTASLHSDGKIEQGERETLDTWIVGDYNGWSNYPTWAVNLWLSNDRGLYEEALARTENQAQESRLDDRVIEGVWTIEEATRFNVADMLKTWVVDELAPDLGASFPADLLGYALGQVDWDEIADAWIEQVTENV